MKIATGNAFCIQVSDAGSTEVTCFQWIEGIKSLDAICLTTLLRKATFDGSDRPAELLLTSVTRRSDAGHG
jgi:hypothetical protein